MQAETGKLRMSSQLSARAALCTFDEHSVLPSAQRHLLDQLHHLHHHHQQQQHHADQHQAEPPSPPSLAPDDALNTALSALVHEQTQLEAGGGEGGSSEAVHSAEVWLETLQQHHDAVLDVHQQVEQLQQRLDHILQLHNEVARSTDEVSGACKTLTADKEALLQHADQLHEALAYFHDDAVLSHRVAHNPENLPLEEWRSILDRLDKCIVFMQSHPEFREAGKYLARLKTVRRTALKTIVNMAEDALRKAASAAASAGRIKDVVEWRACTRPIQPLMGLISERANHASEYNNALYQCQQLYYACRHDLLEDATEAALAALAESSSLAEFARAACMHLVRGCSVEFQLFHDVFSSSNAHSSTLLQLIGSMSSAFYMQMRSLVIREDDIDCLCDVFTILSTEILTDQVVPRGEETEPIIPALKRTIQDVQERLAYRAQVYIRDEVASFTPSDADIDYPDKLSQHESNEDAPHHVPPGDDVRNPAYSSWYPTLEQTLLCLSKLYRCFQRHVFEGIAQEAVSACLHSLHDAAKAIESRSSASDGHLFLIKHMMTLREQLSPFDVEFTVTENVLDLSYLTSAFRDVLAGSGSLLAFLAPHVSRRQVDSRKNLEVELHHVCEVFINQSTSSLVGSVISFLSKAPKSADQPVLPPFDDDESTKEMITMVMSATCDNMEPNLAAIRHILSIYLANEATEQFVLQPILANVDHAIDEFATFVRRRFLQDDINLQPLISLKQMAHSHKSIG